MRIVPSELAVTTSWPSALNCTWLTPTSLPVSCVSCVLVEASQTIVAPLEYPATISLSSEPMADGIRLRRVPLEGGDLACRC